MKGVIVGGGVVGLSVAWEMANEGFECTVIDQGQIGRGCSWAGAGILPPARQDTALDPIDRLRGLSHKIYPQWTEKLHHASGVDPEFRRCGGIYLSRTAGETAALIGQAEYWSEYGIASERLTPERLQQLEPSLRHSELVCTSANGHSTSTSNSGASNSGVSNSGVDASIVPSRSHLDKHSTLDVLRSGSSPNYLNAWYLPDECRVRPPRLLKALRGACENLGVKMLEDTQVLRLVPENANNPTRILGLESLSGRYEADVVVLCCGAWASKFADPIGQLHDVFPVRGQVVQFRLAPGQLHRVINEGHRYLMPREDGCLYVGSSEEEVGLNEGTTPEILTGLVRWARSLVPELEDQVPERTWSGLRPGSMDGFPFIGRSPRWKNLYLASGHFRSGLHLACGTAKVLVETIQNVPTSVPIDAFAVAR